MKLQDIKRDKSLWEKADIDGIGKTLLVEESYYDGIVECIEKIQVAQMNFYKVMFAFGEHIKVIRANNRFEAVGYYLLHVMKYGDIHDVVVEEMEPTEKIEWECIGFPVYKTLEEIYKENETVWSDDTPCVVAGLVS
ncbi:MULTISPECIES: hypothetical protein [Bacillus cereus group]|uniref:Uncharacterized protein n=2 Tax=Bacillus thuringiensis TaxID=1428 RepID=B1N7D9_BACTU|nr:hypothetical protein [Bacillus thuringiensis]MEC2877555.1 hypothetical protein [Bacillus cereus]ABP73623.1 hypothetical protein [Bacillus thuringiensis]AEA19682.1 hypothetical protein CT43_P51066 [Bacillus thuringiensis serovar chinensis CT-43]ARP61683.1 hypothetical protein CAB88_32270 [Bacillus thuringiensis]ARP61755.1 hypothetical protein CAB88_32660 [Bacillus thuringiensis]